MLRWNKIVASGPRPNPMNSHRAVGVKENMIVFGGNDKTVVFNEINVFNTNTNQWYVPAVKGIVPEWRVSCGLAVHDTRIFVFGGMSPLGSFSNDLYELNTIDWTWFELNKISLLNDVLPPSPRIGHSFTMIGNKIYVFGGLTNKNKIVNDLYALEIQENIQIWEELSTFGEKPLPRKSHSAIVYQFKQSGELCLVIYGGMNEYRLCDLWILNINSMTWIKPQINGVSPFPRSLHTSTVIGHRMYIIGGCITIELINENLKNLKSGENLLVCLNLETMTWENFKIDNYSNNAPIIRIGHSAVKIHDRIYILCGRHEYNKNNTFKDFWYLEKYVPLNITENLQTKTTIEIEQFPMKSIYFLEIKKLEHLLPSAKQQQLSEFVNCSVSESTNAVSHAKPISAQVIDLIKPSDIGNNIITMNNSNFVKIQTKTENSVLEQPIFRNQQSNIVKTITKTTTTNNNGTTINNNFHLTSTTFGTLIDFTTPRTNFKVNNLTKKSRWNPMFTINKTNNLIPKQMILPRYSKLGLIGGSPLNSPPPSVDESSMEVQVKTDKKVKMNDVADANLNENLQKEQQQSYSDSESSQIPDLLQASSSKTTKLKPSRLPFKADTNCGTSNGYIPFKSEPSSSTSSENQTASSDSDDNWNLVGIFDALTQSCTVKDYIDYNEFNSSMIESLTSDNIPDLLKYKRINLEPGTTYRFRMSAVNSIGRGEWSEPTTFRTVASGYPGAPSSIKISKASYGVIINWEPPMIETESNEVYEYSVYLCVKPEIPGLHKFVRIYCGPSNHCLVENESLSNSYIDNSDLKKPAVIFRIAACNDKGYGPATQVRWVNYVISKNLRTKRDTNENLNNILGNLKYPNEPKRKKTNSEEE